MTAGGEAGAVLEASGEVSDREELLDGRMQVVLDGEAAGRPLSCALTWTLGRAGEVAVEEADLTFETDEGELNALLSADLGGGVVRVDPDTGQAVAELTLIVEAAAGDHQATARSVRCSFEIGVDGWSGVVRLS